MMTEKNDKLDYTSIQQKALEQFKSRKSLLGKDGAFAPLFNQFFEAALNAELEPHICDSGTPICKNGKTRKTIRTGDSQFALETSRDGFHFQRLALDAVQEMRIKLRGEAINAENDGYEKARQNGEKYLPEVLYNGDTLK